MWNHLRGWRNLTSMNNTWIVRRWSITRHVGNLHTVSNRKIIVRQSVMKGAFAPFNQGYRTLTVFTFNAKEVFCQITHLLGSGHAIGACPVQRVLVPVAESALPHSRRGLVEVLPPACLTPDFLSLAYQVGRFLEKFVGFRLQLKCPFPQCFGCGRLAPVHGQNIIQLRRRSPASLRAKSS
jgi:hypothetical protein